MNFIRENLLKIVIILGVLILITILIGSCSSTKNVPVEEEYTKMEENLISAAKALASKNSRFLPKKVGDEKSIKLSTLVANEEINDLYAIEDKNVQCSGYVLIQHKTKKSYKFIPHLKCGKYYETKTIAEYILDKEKIVTEDDGLYQNGVGYIFRGENPNNFVLFDENLYRIISINQDNELKLISTKSFDDSVVWDDRYNSDFEDYYGINNFEKSRIKENLEGFYYDEDYMSKATRSFIVNHDICIGRRSENESADLSGSLECSAVSKNNKIGLIAANEYLNASIDPKCVSAKNLECGNYNYFSNISSRMTTQTASKDNTADIYVVVDGVLETTKASQEFSVYPVFYIDKHTLYKSGKGTENSPYILR